MNNNGFVIYTEYREKTKRLSDEQFGKLLRYLFEYKETLEEPVIDDPAVGIAFDFIRCDIDRQNDNYEKKVNAGRKGGEAKAEASTKKQKVAKSSTAKQPLAEPSETDNNNYNYNNNKKEKNKKEKSPDVAVATLDAPESVKQKMQGMVNMRKAIKKPMTGNAVDLMYKRLLKLSSDPDVQCQIIDQSIRNSWQDLYALKQDRASPVHKNAFTTGLVTTQQHEDQYADVIKAIENGTF